MANPTPGESLVKSLVKLFSEKFRPRDIDTNGCVFNVSYVDQELAWHQAQTAKGIDLVYWHLPKHDARYDFYSLIPKYALEDIMAHLKEPTSFITFDVLLAIMLATKDQESQLRREYFFALQNKFVNHPDYLLKLGLAYY